MKKIFTLLCGILLLAGFVRIAESQVTVSGASADVNGTYTNTFSYNGKPAYERSSGIGRDILWRSDVSEWRFTDVSGAGRYYYNTANTATPPNVGWLVGEDGTAPAPVAGGGITSLLVGDGSGGSPYQIASLNGLYWIAQNTSEWDKHFVQTANIDASETATWSGGGWTPIGTWGNFFTGSYQGNNHTINALTIDRNSDNQGLFGHIRSTGGIYNLGLTNVDITGATLVGALSGAVDGGATVYHCYSTGSITTTEMGYCGGLIGYSGDVTIIQSYSECTVTSPGGYHVGGLIGLADESTIDTCRSTGNVQGDYAVGGLIGNLRVTSVLQNSYSTGNVTGTGSNTGGLTGNVDNSTISSSHSRGTVIGKTTAGGLVGYMYLGTISNCYSHSDVTIDNARWEGGGLVGNSETGTIEFCYSTGSVSGVSNIGGFIGFRWETPINASFWDTQTSGMATSNGGTGKTTAEMKTASTFLDADWSGSIWKMDGAINDGYPYLSWENPSGTPMPAELVSFTATTKGRGVELAWRTATELNNYGFEIERSVVGQTFLFDHSNGQAGMLVPQWEKIGFIEGRGTANAPQSYTFVDGNASGTLLYRLKQIDRDGSFEYSNQVEVTIAAPVEFALMQNHPNPFNPATSINYTLPASGFVTLKVYDMLGKEVATLVNGMQDAGAKIAKLDASQLPSGISAKGGYASGVYFYTLRTNNFTATKKMLLLK
jgi:hypothetical protein